VVRGVGLRLRSAARACQIGNSLQAPASSLQRGLSLRLLSAHCTDSESTPGLVGARSLVCHLMKRDDYLHLLRDRRARFAAVLDGLGLSLGRDADLQREVGGGWTLGEHLVHLAAWERRTARRVTGRDPLSYPNPWQKFNDAVYAEWRGVTPKAARAEYEDAHREFIAAVRSLPVEDERYRGWDLSSMASHYREHATILLEAAGRPKPPVWRGRIVE
jgi:hypothetical protein